MATGVSLMPAEGDSGASSVVEHPVATMAALRSAIYFVYLFIVMKCGVLGSVTGCFYLSVGGEINRHLVEGSNGGIDADGHEGGIAVVVPAGAFAEHNMVGVGA